VISNFSVFGRTHRHTDTHTHAPIHGQITKQYILRLVQLARR